MDSHGDCSALSKDYQRVRDPQDALGLAAPQVLTTVDVGRSRYTEEAVATFWIQNIPHPSREELFHDEL